MSDIMQTDQLVGGDVELSPILPVFPTSSKPCINVWMDKMSKGMLASTHFKEHWRIWVPQIYSPELNGNCLGWSFDEDMAQKMLYNTLEEFICNGDPIEVLQQLRQMENPPSVCGRFFKVGEPTYFCRECGMDPTCVLCVTCFKESAHQNHKYKIATSAGGGCCDCGDSEAWKNEPYCNIHLAGKQAQESCGNKLPIDIAERATATFEAVLQYCYELLSLEHAPGLPADLSVKDTDEGPLSSHASTDIYCTVLFNDETHTFEQVINTLARVIKCSPKEAIEFVTNIDRNGRAVVKCSGFQLCNELKSDIERFTSRQGSQPLKVLVVHAHVIAHQIFAMKLLDWLQQFINNCKGFRMIFSDVALHKNLPDKPVVQGILMRDAQLWKAARTVWHRLFISGMLMDYESKKALAIVFTANYGSVMKDFIRDDHDHSFSISSLSVQLFTVPTLAHNLIANHDVLYHLLNTFYSESSRRLNAIGKLEFVRSAANTTFKRAQYILCDLAYLLSSKPDVWTDELRRGFLHGLTVLLKLLWSMQCMDAVVRQVGQHMEYEPEWESAFNLQIKLSPVISLALEWCGSDRTVLIKSMRLVLKKFMDEPNDDYGIPIYRQIAGHKAYCLQYDVSSELVSIHLPLSRFLAGLFLYLEKYNLEFPSNDLIANMTPLKSEQIIEPVLRAQAMISQVHAGMWRRNGYSLLNQLYFYHNVRCRTEMLDRDIILLQVGASLIEGNEFLIHLLNKFNLLNWADPEYETNALKNPEEDSIRQIVNLVEEFLGLLITIIGERHVPGIGQITNDDKLKKEIMQQLCIKPMSHSELNKTLPDGVHHETGLERVINDVADFKKPSPQTSAGKGLYELKPALYDEYNVFFYHYTKEELSKSEEAQRKRRKTMGELECCPPPLLPKLTNTFQHVANLLKTDVMLHIIQTVLERALNLRARSFSEPQVHKILHLIGYALQEQMSGYYPLLNFTQQAVKHNIYKLLEDLSSSPRIDAHKDLLKWIIAKYREAAGSAINEDNSVSIEESSQPIAESSSSSSSSSTVVETTSTSGGGGGGGDPAKSSKEWRTQMAAQKRAKIMAQMEAMQKHFMKKNAKLFEEAALDTNKSNERGSSMDLSECSEEAPMCLGSKQTARLAEEKTYTCILCQEDQAVTPSGKAMVLAAFVQQSTVLCQTRNDPDEPNSIYLSSKLGASPHTSTCGHVMHASCWQKHFDNVLAKENRRPYRLRQPASFDVEKHEYLCPLCECLSNTVLPLLPSLATIQPTEVNRANVDFETWLDALKLIIDCKGKINSREFNEVELENEHDACRYCKDIKITDDSSGDDGDDSMSEGNFACPIRRIYKVLGKEIAAAFDIQTTGNESILSEHLVSMIHLFAQATYTKGLGVEPHDGDSRVPLLAWKSTAYTIHSIEFLLRDTDKPLLGALSSRQRDSLECLARISALLGSTWLAQNDNKNNSNISSDDNNGGSGGGERLSTFANYAINILTMILENPSDGDCFTDWDPFGILVILIVTLPSLLSKNSDIQSPIITGNFHEAHALKLVFIGLIVKILATSEFEDEPMDIDMQDDIIDDNNEKYEEYDSLLKLMDSIGVKTGCLMASEIWKRIKLSSMPFLRCCVLYFHYITDVPAPIELTTRGGDTFENMCTYLGLPITCDGLFESEIIRRLGKLWVQHPKLNLPTFIKEPLKINGLVNLPDDYSELINTVSLFTCPNSDREDSRNPTMCLVCGEMLCSQSYCCQIELNKNMVGACTYHASKCGTGVGIFLRVRECEILFLRSPNRGAFACPPYLDEYGETDQGLRRGNPLKLCKDKYRQLNQMWLGHGLHEAVARAIESSSNLMPTQWQHL